MYLLGIVFFNYTATTEIYTHLLTLSLNDALPIWPKSPLLSTNDAGGGSTVAQIELEEGTDVFIPVTINREAADAISGGCTIQCFPRSVHLDVGYRSEEHTSELQSLMRLSYAVFCLKQQTAYITPTSITL